MRTAIRKDATVAKFNVFKCIQANEVYTVGWRSKVATELTSLIQAALLMLSRVFFCKQRFMYCLSDELVFTFPK